MQQFSGLGVFPGVGLGAVHRVDRRRVASPHRRLQNNELEAEVGRFERAVDESEQQLLNLEARAREDGLIQVQTILGAHGALLRDEALFEATKERITERKQNAEWALQDTLVGLKELFDRVDGDYFKERRSDLDTVGDRVLRNLTGDLEDTLVQIPEEAVIVAYDLSPGDVVGLARSSARAFVTESGGPTSHTAILARALGVPCVLKVQGIMQSAAAGDAVVVDGESGDIWLRPTDDVRDRLERVRRRRQVEIEALLKDRDVKAETLDGRRIRLSGNIGVTSEAETVVQFGGEGIGLYRTEFAYAEKPDLSSADDHYELYVRVVRSLEGRPLTVRSVDRGQDKGEAVASGMGLRAIRHSLVHRDRFEAQLAGVLRAAVHGPVRLLLPFVTRLGELREAREVLASVAKSLEEAGVPHRADIQVGVMIETPAAVWLATPLAREADFFSIGTNDLVQFILAVSRSETEVASLYRPNHPAILHALRQVLASADSEGIDVCVCGEMAADPFHVPLLLGLGVTHLSLNARAIPAVKRLVRRLKAEDCEDLIVAAMACETADEVEEQVQQRLQAWLPDLFAGRD